MAFTNLGTNSRAASKSQPQSAHVLTSRPSMRYRRWQALMHCQIAAYILHRSLDNPYILPQLVKFGSCRQIRNLSLHIPHRLKYRIQLAVLVLHQHAEMVDCLLYFIHTTSLAPNLLFCLAITTALTNEVK